ncbi:MAG TPA: putative PEP-binding protein [Candidatus Limnocylindrales bacterium]|nr:putative PEP-binding protein [Candidatus Limnocylindrales bacterium]
MIISGRVVWKRAPAPREAVLDAREAMRRAANYYEERAETAPAEAAAMLLAQAMMARDPLLLQRIDELTGAGLPPDRAIAEAAASLVAAASPGVGSQGAASAVAAGEGAVNLDVRDVVDRAIAFAGGLAPPAPPNPGYPHVLVAQSLSAADMLDIDRTTVVGIVTVEGGPTSHAAILARSFAIPAIIGYPESHALKEGELVHIEVPPAPTRDTATVSRRVPLLANISSAADAALAATVADGVGLLRTEFLHPSLDYAPLIAAFDGKPVIIRALDLSEGDRDGDPLGVRGLRYLRAHPDLLDAQLAAIARLGRPVSVMAPMVSTVDDARWFAARARAHGLADVGVMIEVPAAALCADEILAVVDFASIGTNDLVQFTLAASREAAALASYQDASHPAVLRLIEMTIAAGKRCGKPVSVCGEAAADPAFAATLIGLGASSLSLAPAAIPLVRNIIS